MELRALNRATLHRQLLLERHEVGVVEAIEVLCGLNAQHLDDPYVALHSRLRDFQPGELTKAIEEGTVVRSCLMRATQHLVGASQFGRLRPILAPMLERVQRNAFGRRTAGVDHTELISKAREILGTETMTRPELGRALAQHWPEHESTALAWSVQYLLPLTHPAPFGRTVQLRLAEVAEPDPKWMIRWYLHALGPAKVADMRAWSGVAGLREVVAAMSNELVELPGGYWDLPDAPRPDPDTPAPVRLVAGFDNLLLAFADRRRIMTDEVRARVCVGDLIEPTILVDGFVQGAWSWDRRTKVVTLKPFTRLRRADEQAAIAEAHRLASIEPVIEVRVATAA